MSLKIYATNCQQTQSCRSGIFYYLVVGVVLLLALGGLFSYEKFSGAYFRQNYLPAVSIIELVVVLTCVLGIRRSFGFGKLCLSVFLLGWFAWGLTLYFFRFQSTQYLYDFLIIYKAIVYLALLSLCSDRLFHTRDVVTLFKVLIVVFLLKYISARLFFGIDRPGIFTENNFELLMLMMLYALIQYFKLGLPKQYRWGLYLVVFLSGSLSGVGTLLVLTLMLSPTRRLMEFIKNYFALMAVGIIVVLVALSRFADFDSLQAIDRLLFAQVFWNEVKDFGWASWMLGTPVITPLNPASCEILSFYESLFSVGNPGQCFSVILHSFILRSIFDHGVLGTLAVFACSYYLVFRVYRNHWFALILLVLPALNGLSVSSFNNTFYAMAMVLVIGAGAAVRQRDCQTPPSGKCVSARNSNAPG